MLWFSPRIMVSVMYRSRAHNVLAASVNATALLTWQVKGQVAAAVTAVQGDQTVGAARASEVVWLHGCQLMVCEGFGDPAGFVVPQISQAALLHCTYKSDKPFQLVQRCCMHP